MVTEEGNTNLEMKTQCCQNKLLLNIDSLSLDLLVFGNGREKHCELQCDSTRWCWNFLL